MSAVPSASSDAATAGRNDTGSGQSQGQGRSQSQSQSQSQNSGRGEGSSGAGNEQRRASTSRTLADVMREPSTTTPGVMVLDSLPEAAGRKDVLDPKEDLWLSTVDGRYSSPIIPLRVGEAPYHETFYVHKHVLLKSEYFEKALCGEFKESGMQSIDLPEENPAIFHFLVAYLYEGKYEPIRPAASVLVPDQDKGKGNAADAGGGSDSESASSIESDVSARSRRRHDRHRRREDRNWERMRRKHPGIHRPNCNCPQCAAASGPPCWSCRAPRNPPPYYHPPHTVYVHDGRPERQPRRPPRRRHQAPGVPPPPPPLTPPLPPAPGGGGPAATGTGASSVWADPNGGRISGEDLRTWLLTYELHMDVYIVANKFLLEGFKKEVARAAVDMLETAGSDAGVAEVLFLCRKLYDGLPESDPLLKMIFARVGFLQPWRRAEREATDFLAANPEIAPLLLREMAARREDDINGRALPSMVRPWYAYGGNGGPNGGGGMGGNGNGMFGPAGGPVDVFPPPGGAGAYRGWPGAPGPGPGHHARRGW